MPELQLKVVKNTGDGIWGKALNNLNKVLYSSGGGLFNLVISSKRNALLRASSNYEGLTSIAKESKRNAVTEKYEKAYDNYLNVLERYIKENIYTRAQKRVSTIKENKILSEYYEVNALKGTEYCEYKYRRQMMLLAMDFENILVTKSGYFLEKYEKFYVSVIEQLYKGTMRHYSIKLTNKNEDKDSVFGKIYNLIEGYINSVLPYVEQTEDVKRYIDTYKNYVATIDLYAKKEISALKRELYLLELGINIFSYCLPLLAAEECYLNIISKARNVIPNTYITADKFEAYELLLDAIESYYYNVLAKKTTWDDGAKKQEFLDVWDKLMEYKKLEKMDLYEYKRLREVLFVTNDIKYLKKENIPAKELLAYYRERMKQQGGLRKFKNSVKKVEGKWRTRRRCEAS